MSVRLVHRPRRLRRSAAMRRLVRETHVTQDDLIYPMFVTHGPSEPIAAMPGIRRLGLDDLCKEATAAVEAGIPGILLFGIPAEKDEVGSEAYAEEGIIPRALRRLRSELGEALLLIADVCLCEYTSHGHCGIVRQGRVDNDATVELLQKCAVVYAAAGADIVAPSDMMDGRVGAIRSALDDAGFTDCAIMAYSAKYASAFYGPFREAAGSTPQFGDRRGYQMDPANAREALREIALDLEEGADIVMVKPALPYLDVIRLVREVFDAPLAAYNVSGEFSMLKAASARGWIDEQRAVAEVLHAIKRAGADIIITYHALEYVRALRSG
ncbi:MAG: porphobilinogen synthase [Chthonomonadales bacterium]